VIVVGVTSKDELVATGVAAKQIGVHRGTLVRWWQQGLVEPELVTPGGQARWDVGKLKQQLRERRPRDE
jgi:DNA-binding transcriptional MerR regulator